MMAASASTARQPIHGSMRSVSLHWFHFPTCFPSTDIWLRPCWDPWPSFPHDQDVSSCCMQCPGLPRALQSPSILLTLLHNPCPAPPLPPPQVNGSSAPFSALDLHRPPSKNPGALGRNAPYRAVHSSTVVTHPSTSYLPLWACIPPKTGSSLPFLAAN